MSALPLVLAIALASPGTSLEVVPRTDPGPFGGEELVASSLGVVTGDVLVLGAGYGVLRLFANDTLRPTASNFRTTAYALGLAAVVVPPLTAALLGRWARAEPASGSFWKAMLLATAGQAVALAAGIAAYPRLWVILPLQLVAVSVGTTVGLHWGPRGRAPDEEVRREEPRPVREARREPLCPDPALAVRS